jgi:hypothetical protein
MTGAEKLLLRWIPQALDANQMTEQARLSCQLLQIMRSNQEQSSRNIAIGGILVIIRNLSGIRLVAVQR